MKALLCTYSRCVVIYDISPKASGAKNGGTEPDKAIFGVGFSLTYALRTAYIGEYLLFRYLKCLVNVCLHKDSMYTYVYIYTHFLYFLSSCAPPGIIFYQRFAWCSMHVIHWSVETESWNDFRPATESPSWPQVGEEGWVPAGEWWLPSGCFYIRRL